MRWGRKEPKGIIAGASLVVIFFYLLLSLFLTNANGAYEYPLEPVGNPCLPCHVACYHE
jgi:hypothetical protein